MADFPWLSLGLITTLVHTWPCPSSVNVLNPNHLCRSDSGAHLFRNSPLFYWHEEGSMEVLPLALALVYLDNQLLSEYIVPSSKFPFRNFGPSLTANAQASGISLTRRANYCEFSARPPSNIHTPRAPYLEKGGGEVHEFGSEFQCESSGFTFTGSLRKK